MGSLAQKPMGSAELHCHDHSDHKYAALPDHSVFFVLIELSYGWHKHKRHMHVRLFRHIRLFRSDHVERRFMGNHCCLPFPLHQCSGDNAHCCPYMVRLCASNYVLHLGPKGSAA